MDVELRQAGVPFLGRVAVHYWFNIKDGDRTERWEVWQTPDRNWQSVGHLHRNLLKPEVGVGGGLARLERLFSGAEAQRLARVLRSSWAHYPFRHQYRYFPGPNSNTYVAWILREAGIDHDLSWKGVGKAFLLTCPGA